jgi:hypothetical protein
MSGAELAQIITSLATLLGAIAGLVVSLRNSRKIKEVHESTNGKMDALIAEVREASFAKGVLSEKDRDGSRNPLV